MRFSHLITGEYADEDEHLAQRDVEGASFRLIDECLYLWINFACF